MATDTPAPTNGNGRALYRNAALLRLLGGAVATIFVAGVTSMAYMGGLATKQEVAVNSKRLDALEAWRLAHVDTQATELWWIHQSLTQLLSRQGLTPPPTVSGASSNLPLGTGPRAPSVSGAGK